MDKTAHDFQKTARGARRFHFNYISTPCMILLDSQNETDKQISRQDAKHEAFTANTQFLYLKRFFFNFWPNRGPRQRSSSMALYTH